MTNNILLTSINNHIAQIVLNKPEKHNALDEVLIQELTSTLEKLANDNNVRVIILSANGKSFCAGADLSWMQKSAQYTREQNINDALNLARLMTTLNQLTKPVIAVAHGNIFGGGVGIISCCDIVLAAPNTVFCLSEVKLGLIPAVISPYVIAAIGQRQARRYFLTAEIISAEHAKTLNLVHDIIPQEQLVTTTLTLAEKILQNAPGAVSKAKQLIHAVANCICDEKLTQFTAEKIADIRIGKEAQEGFAAFFAKRKPEW